jgi:enoyl-CoA hydratase/carnithine racemase
LVREIGPALTKELVMTCREFGPEEARAAGFLNRVVDDDVSTTRSTSSSPPSSGCQARTPGDEGAHQRSHRGDGVDRRSWSDVDGLLAALRDPDGRDSARRYLERVRSTRT